MKNIFENYIPDIDSSDESILKDYYGIFSECYSFSYKMFDIRSIREFAESDSFGFFSKLIEGIKHIFDKICQFFRKLLARLKKKKRLYESELTYLKSVCRTATKYNYDEKANIIVKDMDYRIIGGCTEYDGIIKGVINRTNAITSMTYDDLTVGDIIAKSTHIMHNIKRVSEHELLPLLAEIDGALRYMLDNYETSDAWSIAIYKSTVSDADKDKFDDNKSVAENITKLHGTKRITLRGNGIVESDIAKQIYDSITNFDISNMMGVLDESESFFDKYSDEFSTIIKKLSYSLAGEVSEDDYRERYNFAVIYGRVLTNFASMATMVFNTSKIELDNYLTDIKEYCDALVVCRDQYGTSKTK